MSPDLVAVLVVPAVGDPGGLLAPGRCGIIPAIAEMRHTYDPDGRPGPKEWTLASNRWTAEPALPLWWDGALVPEGWDRARRIACRIPFMARPPSVSVFYPGSVEWPLLVAQALVDAGLASRVVRLACVAVHLGGGR